MKKVLTRAEWDAIVAAVALYETDLEAEDDDHDDHDHPQARRKLKVLARAFAKLRDDNASRRPDPDVARLARAANGRLVDSSAKAHRRLAVALGPFAAMLGYGEGREARRTGGGR